MSDFPAPLPPGVSARLIPDVNGLTMRVLEAGEGPLVLLLHGFPELAWSWRKVIPALAAAGFRVVAPDQRGYGGTTGWDGGYDDPLGPVRLDNLATDALALLRALGADHCFVVGHDFGSPVAGWAALTRPDVFRRVALMSAPFAGGPALAPAASSVHADFAKLGRKHYQHYYATPAAAAEMDAADTRDFFLAYYHMKSADWPGNDGANRPHRLPDASAKSLAVMPEYYIMAAGKGMAETVAPHLPPAPPGWLTEPELAVYAAEYSRRGLTGPLQWYRAMVSDPGPLRLFEGKTIDVPAIYIAGAQDWGVYQSPGALERMEAICADFRGVRLIEGAGHWVQQEKPEETARLLTGFLTS